MAGAVRSRGEAAQTTSDWMEIEKQRGISVSTSVLQFDYPGRHMNLLDTPGHKDFSEDTYRTLAAADTAIMLIDCVKGVEPQTIKLFQVCRMRGIPIVTFVNKMDRDGKDPLDLLDEIERVLGIPCSPANWPIGTGDVFAGVYDRWTQRLLLFDGGSRSAARGHARERAAIRPSCCEAIGENAHGQGLREEMELLETAGTPSIASEFLAGQIDAGVLRQRHDQLRARSAARSLRRSGASAAPARDHDGHARARPAEFSGFVFKIQANMDPQHRDRIAFLRICSGRFVRGMDVRHVRTGKTLSLARSVQFMAQERTVVDEAYRATSWACGIRACCASATACARGARRIRGHPALLARALRARAPQRSAEAQAAQEGLDQLSEEGAVQLFFDRKRHGARSRSWAPWACCNSRSSSTVCTSEYGVRIGFDRLPYRYAAGSRARTRPRQVGVARPAKLRDRRGGPTAGAVRNQIVAPRAQERNKRREIHLRGAARPQPPGRSLAKPAGTGRGGPKMTPKL